MHDITTPLHELDKVTRVDHFVGDTKTHSIITHIERGALIKCMECKIPQDRKAFYITKTGRASPYCIACNTDAALKANYARELKREGVAGFTKRIQRKEHQLSLMLKAVTDFQRETIIESD